MNAQISFARLDTLHAQIKQLTSELNAAQHELSTLKSDNAELRFAIRRIAEYADKGSLAQSYAENALLRIAK